MSLTCLQGEVVLYKDLLLSQDLAPGGIQMLGDKASSIHELWDRDPGPAQQVTTLDQFPSGQPDGCQEPSELGCLE